MTQTSRKEPLPAVSTGAIVGRRREQQDTVWSGKVRLADGQTAVLICLADGMGGAVGGQRASELAVETFRGTFAADESNASLKSRLTKALDAANKAIAREIVGNPGLKGMGTTLIGAVLRGRALTWVSVGDSLLLEVTQRGVRRLNADHSYSELLDKAVQRGEMTRIEAQSSSQRHVLRSAVIGDRIAMTDADSRELQPGSWLVVASDGLLTLSMRRISAICATTRDGAELVKSLFAAIEAEMPSDQDNTTLAVARLSRSGGGKLLSGPVLAIVLGSVTLFLALGALAYLALTNEPALVPAAASGTQSQPAPPAAADDNSLPIENNQPDTPINTAKIVPFGDPGEHPPTRSLNRSSGQPAPPVDSKPKQGEAPPAKGAANVPAPAAPRPVKPASPAPAGPPSQPEAKDLTFKKPGDGA